MLFSRYSFALPLMLPENGVAVPLASRILKGKTMWYFAWILGVTMAVLLASMSAMMCDAKECALDDARKQAGDDAA